MMTRSATATAEIARLPAGQGVTTAAHLYRCGWSMASVRAQLDAGRWQRAGRALVLHSGPLHPDELPRIAVLNCGPRAGLTAFTCAQLRGLRGWERPELHVLVAGGTRIRRPPGVPLRVHWSNDWRGEVVRDGMHALAPALVRAAATFSSARPACGILAAGVQQRLVTPDQLAAAVIAQPRIRHRAALRLALDDIAQGAQALSEIDFGLLCRRNGLPAPVRQAVRVDSAGRRRYLDAEWISRSGRRVVAEIDGALHLTPRRWWDDQLRQNDIVIGGDVLLRFPTVVVRCEERSVAAQLRRALDL
jgi:hypothetical protein